VFDFRPSPTLFLFSAPTRGNLWLSWHVNSPPFCCINLCPSPTQLTRTNRLRQGIVIFACYSPCPLFGPLPSCRSHAAGSLVAARFVNSSSSDAKSPLPFLSSLPFFPMEVRIGSGRYSLDSFSVLANEKSIPSPSFKSHVYTAFPLIFLPPQRSFSLLAAETDTALFHFFFFPVTSPPLW